MNFIFKAENFSKMQSILLLIFLKSHECNKIPLKNARICATCTVFRVYTLGNRKNSTI